MHKSQNTMSFNPFRRSFAAVMALAVLLQMSMVSVTYSACSSKGTERIALGELKSCCTPPVFDFSALSQKCCDIETSEAVFFNFKDSKDDLGSFSDALDLTHFVLSAEATVTVPLHQVETHIKSPPSPGQVLLVRDCRLNV